MWFHFILSTFSELFLASFWQDAEASRLRRASGSTSIVLNLLWKALPAVDCYGSKMTRRIHSSFVTSVYFPSMIGPSAPFLTVEGVRIGRNH